MAQKSYSYNSRVDCLEQGLKHAALKYIFSS